MSVTDSASTWSSYLSDLSVSEHDRVVYSEDDFHRAFVEFCIDIRERDPQRLLAKFLRHHNQIIAFIGALDECAGLRACNTLGSVFWSKALATVLTALKRRQKEALFRMYYPCLSDAVPAFGADLSVFPDNEQVQKPLQSIFKIYMECHEAVLRHLQSSSPLGFEPLREHIEFVSQKIAAHKTEWEERVQETTKELAAAKQSSAQYSYYNSTSGPLNPKYSTKASFEWIELLGEGSYGEVTKVRETSTDTFYARKTISVTDPSSRPRIEEVVRNEVFIRQKLRHHHIASVQFHVFEEEKCSIIILPVAECDLDHFLRKPFDGCLPTAELDYLTKWFGCLISALAFAHSKNVIHEDIKPTNILIKDH